MKNIILWTTLLVLLWTITFPPLMYSKKRAVRVARDLLHMLMAAIIGFNCGQALIAVLS